MAGALFFFGVAALFVWLLVRNLMHNSKIKKQPQVAQQQKDTITQSEIKEKMCSMIASDFEELGWTEWDESIHRNNEQYDRLRRAVSEEESIRLLQYSNRHGLAIIQGTQGTYLVNGHRCSCPDFRGRGLPCKHMYALAIILPDYIDHLSPTKFDDPPDYVEDGILYGLKFGLIGRGQEEVKQYVNRHSGILGNESWRETSAVILASDQHTQRLDDARRHNVEIMTFAELKDFVEACKEAETTITAPPLEE